MVELYIENIVEDFVHTMKLYKVHTNRVRTLIKGPTQHTIYPAISPFGLIGASHFKEIILSVICVERRPRTTPGTETNRKSALCSRFVRSLGTRPGVASRAACGVL